VFFAGEKKSLTTLSAISGLLQSLNWSFTITYHWSSVVHSCRLSATELFGRCCSCLEQTTTPRHAAPSLLWVFWLKSHLFNRSFPWLAV